MSGRSTIGRFARGYAAVAILAPLAMAAPLEAGTMSEVYCEIRTHSMGATVELVGLAWGDGSLAGNYQFIVNKNGSGGVSRVVQQGLFSTIAHQPTVLGTVSVNAGAGDRFVARLVVEANDVEKICELTSDNLA